MRINKDTCLYQWDINQKLIDVSGTSVDFIINNEVYRVLNNDGVLIPDELLQVAGKYTCYENYPDGTIREWHYEVIERPQPPDYIYTPTERLTFDALVQKVNTVTDELILKAERGDFDGKDYVITPADYQAIADRVDTSALGDRVTVVEEAAITLDQRVNTLDNETLDIYQKLEGKQDELIAGDNITIQNNVISATSGSSLNHIHLYCDGFGICYFKDKDDPDMEYLTFNQIKSIIENDNNIIFITNGFYSFYSKYYYYKSISHQDTEAIGFIGETQLNGNAYSWRIAINENDEVTEDEIKLVGADKINYYVKDALVNNDIVLTDPEKLKIETWLGLSENYLTYYNETPYQVTGNYVPAHKKFVEDYVASHGGGGGGSVVDITPILSGDSEQVITNAPAFYNNKYKWFVFKSDINDYAYLDEIPSPTLGYLGYNFGEPTSVVAVKVRYIAESNNITQLKIIGSDDGVSWTDITSVENIGGGNTNFWYTFLFDAPKSYKMYAVQFGEYRNYAKLGAIRFMGMKTPPVDVQINGNSIVDSNNVANIPFANSITTVGVVMPSDAFTVNATSGLMTINPTANLSIDNRYGNYPLTCSKIDYGVKQALCDGKGAAWTDTEKANARARMGAASAINFVDVNVPSKMYVSVAAAAGVPINGVLNVLGLGTEEIAQASIVDARPASFTLCITVSTSMTVRIYYY